LIKGLKWDEFTVDKKLLKLGETIHKYHKLVFDIAKKRIKVEFDRDNRYQELYIHYKFDYDIKLTDKEIKDFVYKDTEYIKFNKTIAEQNNLITFLESSIKNLESVRWDIKNFIEWQKIKNGLI
jgi:hypothetical protein